MKLTAVDWYANELNSLNEAYENGEISYVNYRVYKGHLLERAEKMAEQELKDAYKHGRDDENCALSDGAMAPDYDNAEEWYQGEYGGEQ